MSRQLPLEQTSPLLSLPWIPFRRIVEFVGFSDSPRTMWLIEMRTISRKSFLLFRKYELTKTERFSHEVDELIWATVVRDRRSQSERGGLYNFNNWIKPIALKKLLDGEYQDCYIQKVFHQLREIILEHSKSGTESDVDATTKLLLDYTALNLGIYVAIDFLALNHDQVGSRKELLDHLLPFAAAVGNVPLARHALSIGADVNAISSLFGEPLVAAVKFNRLSMTEFLLEEGADPNILAIKRPLGHLAPINRALRVGYTDVVKLCLRPQYKFKLELTAYQSLLTHLVNCKDASIFGPVLGIRKVAREDLPETYKVALIRAAEKGRLDLIEAIFDITPYEGSNWHRHGVIAIYHAIRGQHIDIIKYLLSRSTNLLSASTHHAGNALIAAADYHNLAIVKLLIEHGADPNGGVGLRSIRTPLIRAASNNYGDIGKYLLHHGASFSPVTLGKSPRVMDLAFKILRFAVQEGLNDVIWDLVKAGADVNRQLVEQDDEGWDPTPLTSDAAASGQKETLNLLLELGATSYDDGAVIKAGADSIS